MMAIMELGNTLTLLLSKSPRGGVEIFRAFIHSGV
jgi:hypothetical protein